MQLTPTTNDTLSSFHRLQRTPFAERFYAHLLASDPAIARAFSKTDFTRQHELFEHGVHMLLQFASGSALGRMAIGRLGALHGPGKLNVSPQLYRHWVEAIIATARELDPEWNSELEQSWRRDVSKGIDEMIRAYGAS